MFNMLTILLLFFNLFSNVSSKETPVRPPPPPQCLRGVIVMGNSLSDTGNAADIFPFVPGNQPPYGVTYPGRPTGRFSDGKLIIDYICDAFLLVADPYFVDVNPDYRTGVNFAQAGSTALNTFFQNPVFFSTQVQEYLQFKQRILSGYNGRRDTCQHSLPPVQFYQIFHYLIEIGGNDIVYNLLANQSLPNVQNNIIPQVIGTIKSTIQLLYDQGARKLLIFGITPLGCVPSIKTAFGTTNTADYDSNKCLIAYNDISAYFNNQLNGALVSLRTQYQDATIYYVDLYNSYFQVINNAQAYGITNTQQACCGKGGLYNYSPLTPCGAPGVPYCSNPRNYISWDGFHYTQRYYEIVANLILTGQFIDPPVNFKQICKL